MLTDEVVALAGSALKKGAAELPAVQKGARGPRPRGLGVSPERQESDESDCEETVEVVHLIRKMPPLPLKTVKLIRKGMYVDFALFPVSGCEPVEAGEDSTERRGKDLDGTGVRKKSRRLKEVPDPLRWHACFSLFQAAWASAKPSMWLPLATYRESINKMAMLYPWKKVVIYDREFRKEAGGNKDTKWEVEDLALRMDALKHSSEGGQKPVVVEPPLDVGSMGARRRGTCFRYNRGEGRCGFGNGCKFSHTCSTCGGEHPAARCGKSRERK